DAHRGCGDRVPATHPSMRTGAGRARPGRIECARVCRHNLSETTSPVQSSHRHRRVSGTASRWFPFVSLDVMADRTVDGRRPDDTRSLVGHSLLVYGLSRLVTLLAAGLAIMARPGIRLIDVVANTWDAGLYMEVVRHGYPHAGFPIGDPHAFNGTAGFFPLYPGAISLVSRTFGISIQLAGVLISLASGAAVTVLVVLLTRDLFGRAAAKRTAALFCFAPGAFVFSLTYAEGMMMLGAVACLLFLLKRRWILAGAAAAFATAARP